MNNEQMKNERAYIPSLIIFMHHLRGLSSGGEQKYLAIFADFCEHAKKRYYQDFRLILWIDGIKELVYLQPESVQMSVLLVCSLPVACKFSGLCKYKQAQRKCLKSHGNRVYACFSRITHPDTAPL